MNSPTRFQIDTVSPPDMLIVLRSLWAGKGLIAAVVAGALAIVALHALLAVPRYVATAELLVEDVEQKVVDFGAAADTTAARETALATEARTLQSRGLVRKLVESLALVDDPEFNPMLRPPGFPSLGWARMQVKALIGGGEASAEPEADLRQQMLSATITRTLDSMEVAIVPETQLVRIRVESKSPEKAAWIANAMARLYIENRLEARFEASTEATRWLGQQVATLKRDLEDAEARLKAFNASAETLGPEGLAAQNLQMKELRERHARSEALVGQASERIAALEALSRGETPAAGREDPVLRPLLRQAQPAPAEIARLVAASRAELERESRFAETLARSITDLEARVERQSAELGRLQQLQREVDANAAIYQFALGRLKELSVERGVQQAGARILSLAEPPLAPAGPGLPVRAALAIALGPMLGTGKILLRPGLHDTFRTTEDVEQTVSIPVLSQIPSLPVRSPHKVIAHITSEEPSLFSEAVRGLRTTLLLGHDKKPSVIALGSAVPGEGKTTLAIALAHSLSRIGSRVLLIDADLRRRSLGRLVASQDEQPGLIAALLDDQPLEEVVVASDLLGVDVLSCESCSFNAADIFSFDEFNRLIQRAKKSYDFIIIDTPPVLSVPDVRLISRCADAMLLVLRWNVTNRLQFVDAVRELGSLSSGIAGCILSQVDPKGMSRYGYGDRLGIYASYRAGYYQV